MIKLIVKTLYMIIYLSIFNEDDEFEIYFIPEEIAKELNLDKILNITGEEKKINVYMGDEKL